MASNSSSQTISISITDLNEIVIVDTDGDGLLDNVDTDDDDLGDCFSPPYDSGHAPYWPRNISYDIVFL